MKGLDAVIRAGLWQAEMLKKHRTAMVQSVFGKIIEDTPKLTGQLVNSWHTSTGAPVIESAEVFTNDRDAPMAEMLEVTANAPIDKPIFMANGARHAYGVEFLGWSSNERPEGMVVKNLVGFGEENFELTTPPKA